MIEHPRPFFYRVLFFFHIRRERTDLFPDLFPDLINRFDTALFHPAIPSDPVIVPLFFPTYSNCDTVIFQLIHLVDRDPGQPTAKITKHTLIGKMLHHKIYRRPDVLHKRIHQDRMFFIDKAGNPALLHHLSGIASVRCHISGDHRKISISVAFCPHQQTDLSGDLLHLFFRIACLKDLYLFLFLPVLPFIIPKQMLLQKFECRCLMETAVFSRMHPPGIQNFHPFFRCHPGQRLHHLPTHPKQMLRTF